MKRKYYSLIQNANVANVYVYGDITSYPYFENDVSSYGMVQEIEGLDVEQINVFINSYGGEVAESLAICTMLKRHKASVTTYNDGFACSAAADLFMAGDIRIVSEYALTMIHNAWMSVTANADGLRKTADDLEIISNATLSLFMEKVNITEDELKALFDAETWLTAQQALDMGFATQIEGQVSETLTATQSVKQSIVKTLTKAKAPPTIEFKIMDLPEMKAMIEELKQLKESEQEEEQLPENKLKKFLSAL